jgi:hypothetical protein
LVLLKRGLDGQPAGKMGGAMWLWALGQQTERIKSLIKALTITKSPPVWLDAA